MTGDHDEPSVRRIRSRDPHAAFTARCLLCRAYQHRLAQLIDLLSSDPRARHAVSRARSLLRRADREFAPSEHTPHWTLITRLQRAARRLEQRAADSR